MPHITNGAIETEGNTPEARVEFAEYVANRASREAYDAILQRNKALTERDSYLVRLKAITEKYNALRAEVVIVHDKLAQAAASEADEVHRVLERESELQRQLAAEKSLRRKAQKYALRQREELKEARAVIADMLDHLTDTLWYPNDDPQVEALRAALGKARGEAQP